MKQINCIFIIFRLTNFINQYPISGLDPLNSGFVFVEYQYSKLFLIVSAISTISSELSFSFGLRKFMSASLLIGIR